MQNLVLFMNTLKDNSNFVALAFVVCLAILLMTVTLSIQRTIRRKQKLDYEERIEQKRIDHSRAITPVTKRMED